MKISVSKAMGVVDIFNTLINVKLDFKLSYRITKIINQVSPKLKTFHNKHTALVLKYGVKDEKGKMEVPEAKREEFSKELMPALMEEFEVNIDLIPLELFEKSEIKMSPEELILIKDFIQE